MRWGAVGVRGWLLSPHLARQLLQCQRALPRRGIRRRLLAQLVEEDAQLGAQRILEHDPVELGLLLIHRPRRRRLLSCLFLRQRRRLRRCLLLRLLPSPLLLHLTYQLLLGLILRLHLRHRRLRRLRRHLRHCLLHELCRRLLGRFVLSNPVRHHALYGALLRCLPPRQKLPPRFRLPRRFPGRLLLPLLPQLIFYLLLLPPSPRRHLLRRCCLCRRHPGHLRRAVRRRHLPPPPLHPLLSPPVVRGPTPLPALLQDVARRTPLEHDALPLRLAHLGAEQHALARLDRLEHRGQRQHQRHDELTLQPCVEVACAPEARRVEREAAQRLLELAKVEAPRWRRRGAAPASGGGGGGGWRVAP